MINETGELTIVGSPVFFYSLKFAEALFALGNYTSLWNGEEINTSVYSGKPFFSLSYNFE
jgi:hypothetical protein